MTTPEPVTKDNAHLLLDELVKEAQRVLPHATDEQRNDFFVRVIEGYCQFCGRRGRCQCWNDE